ncbi:LysR family transcriptional regulator [Anopheles sinensis]|uniref:LysR family transcriptional regulator n=1 Tax=Anopheles sinensis TaxID=74873 RepID=A0A084W5R3_ANOSI|nr:LysR family transcriptional regulator [Anopheles sinensis]
MWAKRNKASSPAVSCPGPNDALHWRSLVLITERTPPGGQPGAANGIGSENAGNIHHGPHALHELRMEVGMCQGKVHLISARSGFSREIVCRCGGSQVPF